MSTSALFHLLCWENVGESWLLKVLVFFCFFNLTHYPLGKNYQNQLRCPVNSDSSSGFGCTYSIGSDLSSREFSPTPVLATPTGGSDPGFSFCLLIPGIWWKILSKEMFPITWSSDLDHNEIKGNNCNETQNNLMLYSSTIIFIMAWR